MTGPSHWTTRETAEICGLTQTTLRWYERIGLVGRVERGSDKRRRYSRSDLDWIRLLSRLRATGMPVKDMLRYADLVRRPGTEIERLELFQAHRRRLLHAMAVQNDCLSLVEKKIEYYRRAVPGTGEEPGCEP
jgi:DNA-binding transcriptional MerR regulator